MADEEMSGCRYCVEGWPFRYYNFYDGRGRKRLHYRLRPDLDYPEEETRSCQCQGWVSRFPLATAILVVGVNLFLIFVAIIIGTHRG